MYRCVVFDLAVKVKVFTLKTNFFQTYLPFLIDIHENFIQADNHIIFKHEFDHGSRGRVVKAMD